jgi:hypothetical protein
LRVASFSQFHAYDDHLSLNGRLRFWRQAIHNAALLLADIAGKGESDCMNAK